MQTEYLKEHQSLPDVTLDELVNDMLAHNSQMESEYHEKVVYRFKKLLCAMCKTLDLDVYRWIQFEPNTGLYMTPSNVQGLPSVEFLNYAEPKEEFHDAMVALKMKLLFDLPPFLFHVAFGRNVTVTVTPHNIQVEQLEHLSHEVG